MKQKADDPCFFYILFHHIDQSSFLVNFIKLYGVVYFISPFIQKIKADISENYYIKSAKMLINLCI